MRRGVPNAEPGRPVMTKPGICWRRKPDWQNCRRRRCRNGPGTAGSHPHPLASVESRRRRHRTRPRADRDRLRCSGPSGRIGKHGLQRPSGISHRALEDEHRGYDIDDEGRLSGSHPESTSRSEARLLRLRQPRQLDSETGRRPRGIRPGVRSVQRRAAHPRLLLRDDVVQAALHLTPGGMSTSRRDHDEPGGDDRTQRAATTRAARTWWRRRRAGGHRAALGLKQVHVVGSRVDGDRLRARKGRNGCDHGVLVS